MMKDLVEIRDFYTDPERLVRARKSKQEMAKFAKEQRMCQVIASNGHVVEHLNDLKGTPDAKIDGVPVDLKATKSANNIVDYAKHAIRDQGAKKVVFEFEKETKEIYSEIEKLKNKYNIHGMYYFKGRNKLLSF